MSKDSKAQAATIAVIVGGLLTIAWYQGGFDRFKARASYDGGFLGIGAPSKPAEPRDVIYAMLDAARVGSVEEYLVCYSGQLERTLRQSLEEMGTERFSEFLRERNRDIKGIAMNAPDESGDEAQVRVEYVYADRNEVQQVYLRRLGKDWKISGVSEIQRVETPVPYGTPVY